MDSIKPQPSDPPKTPEKKRPPSDQLTSPSWITKTPKKLPNPPKRIKHHPHSGRTRSHQLPEKYDMLVRYFDALEVSMKLLSTRKSMPVFSRLQSMVEKMSDRRFTHRHLAQLKYLLPDEIGVTRVLLPDEQTRCVKYDLIVKFAANTRKRKRGSNNISCLRDLLCSRLSHFVRDHPQGSEIPIGDLPEPFNQGVDNQLLNSEKCSSTSSNLQFSDISSWEQPAKSSLFPSSFKKCFSRGGQAKMPGEITQIPMIHIVKPPGASVPKPSVDECRVRSQEALYQPAVQIKCNLFGEGKISSACLAETPTTPTKASVAATEIMAATTTPALQTPKRCSRSPNDDISSTPCKESRRPSCARSLRFDDCSRSVNIELQVDDAECSNILEVLPQNLLQSLKEKENQQIKRKQAIARVPKLFDRIYYLFQSPRPSSIRKEVLIRNLTECHPDITDEIEVEEQLRILEEAIPEWISHRLSPLGNVFYNINKALDPHTLRPKLEELVV